MDEMELMAISYLYSYWMVDLRRHIEKDPWIISKTPSVLTRDGDAAPIANLRFQEDIRFFKLQE